MNLIGFKVPSMRRIGSGSAAVPTFEAPLDDSLAIFYDQENTYTEGATDEWAEARGGAERFTATGAAQPTPNATRNSIQSGGSSTCYANDALAALCSGLNNFTVMMIFRVVSQDATCPLFEFFDTATSKYTFLRAIDAGLDGYLTAFENRPTDVQRTARYTSGVNNDTTYMVIVRSKRAGKLTCNRDGATKVQSTGNAPDVATVAVSATEVALFKNSYAGTSLAPSGTEIMSWVLWDRELSDAEVVTLRGLCSDARKWGSEGKTF